MSIRDELRTLVDQLSDDDVAAAWVYLRRLSQDARAHPLTAQERLARRMGPSAVTGAAFFDQPPVDLATLAAQQGVRPVTNFDDLLVDVWPEDEDVDLFIATLRRWRHEGGDGYGEHI